MNLTPSQLETLRETGSVRVVVKMQHQPQQTLHDRRLWLYDGDLYMWGDPPRISNEFIDAASPLPSPGTIETIDGMECEWVERGCKKASKFTLDEACETGLWRLDMCCCPDSKGYWNYQQRLTQNSPFDKPASPDTWLWTAALRRKDDGDE